MVPSFTNGSAEGFLSGGIQGHDKPVRLAGKACSDFPERKVIRCQKQAFPRFWPAFKTPIT